MSLKIFFINSFKKSNNYQSGLNELIEVNINNQNLSNQCDKNYKFLEILNNNFNYGQKKGYFNNIQIHLNKDEIQFTEKTNNNLHNYLKYNNEKK